MKNRQAKLVVKFATHNYNSTFNFCLHYVTIYNHNSDAVVCKMRGWTASVRNPNLIFLEK